MLEVKSSGDVAALATNAGRLYLRAVDLNQEDFRLRALK
jgi:hypothetical protein